MVVRVENNNNNRMLVGSESEKIEGQLLISRGTLLSVTVWGSK